MATVEFFTGCEGMSKTSDINLFFDARGQKYFSFTMGYDNGKCIRHTNATFGQLRKYVVPKKTICAGFHLRGAQSLSSTDRDGMIAFLYGTGGDSGVIKIYNHPDGVVIVRGDTTIASCTTIVPTGGSIHHVEAKLISHETDGYVGVKLDNVMILEASGLNTYGTDVHEVRWDHNNGHFASSAASGMDNFFVADDWVGELRSVLLLPNVDDSVQFTPDTGENNYSRIAEATDDGDASYVESNQVNHKDIYGFTGLDVGMLPVVATYVVTARKTDVGQRNIQSKAVQDATEYDLTERILTIEYPISHGGGIIDCLGRCPDGTVWDIDKLNAVKWGFEITV